MRRPQFTLKAMLWLTAISAMLSTVVLMAKLRLEVWQTNNNLRDEWDLDTDRWIRPPILCPDCGAEEDQHRLTTDRAHPDHESYRCERCGFRYFATPATPDRT